MNDQIPVWLPHLTYEMLENVQWYELDAYAVALEGWRRGLILEWHSKQSEAFRNIKTWNVDKPGKLFSLSSSERTHYFFRTRGDKVTAEAVEIGGDKEQTKRWLCKAGVRIPEGCRFIASVPDEEIIHYATKIGYPVVLKPTDGSFGRGVMTNLQDTDTLIKALEYVRNQLNFKDVIIERYIEGKEYRIYVVDDEVVGAINRIPANVIGDGKHSIKELIELKNDSRKRNPRLASCLIKPDEEIINHLKSNGYTLNSVPAAGERVFLRNKSNISLGGDPVDVLDELSEEVKNTAVKAIKAIPGLPHGAVDIIVENSTLREQNSFVLEINPTAQIGSLLFPMQGKSRDIPAAIIDYYFPETRDIDTDKTKIYFDLRTVLQPLSNNAAITTQVTSAPQGKLYTKKFTLSGTVQVGSYHRWLRKNALELSLHGQVNNLDNGCIEIIVAGTQQSNIQLFKEILAQYNNKVEIYEVSEEDWQRPVKIGFRIPAGKQELLAEYKKLRKELLLMEKERDKAAKQYYKYQRSTIWAFTYPLRLLGDWSKAVIRYIINSMKR